MTYRGTIHNGVVVFDGAQRPPEGTHVEIRPVGAGAAPAKFDELLGGWPAGEEGDGFEDAVARWRSEEPRRAEF
jgi:hypothetical protein